MDESRASAVPVDESLAPAGPAPPVTQETQLDGSEGAGPPTAAERPNFLTRADLESKLGSNPAVADETFVIPTLPAEVDQGGPESVDLGIPDRRVGGRRAMLEWGSVVVGALVLAILVRTFLFGAYYIPSPSMEPTLSIGDRIVVNKVSYRLHDVNRGI
ncbi:MAG: hypothetical protein CM1200mP26_11560 [Acidimicrobiales bacterium]|nr:MAG: hypothetical protein CM1200mP26_11560 [Acidimicrobiales bacterium]